MPKHFKSVRNVRRGPWILQRRIPNARMMAQNFTTTIDCVCIAQ